MSHAAGSSRTYPSQSVFALYHIVQPNDPHILFTCNTHKRVVRGAAGFYCARMPASQKETD